MWQRFLCCAFIALNLSCSTLKSADERVEVLDWSSEEGMTRLERSRHKVDFFKLANQFESQTNKIVCGPTTSAIVLNSLRLYNPDAKKPVDKSLLDEKYTKHLPKGFDPRFERYTQHTFFSPETNKIKTAEEVFGKPIDGKNDYGLQLRQLYKILNAHGLSSQMRIVDEKLSSDAIRKELAENLKTKGDYVIVNYARKELNQKGGGHISPLGAYDEESDSFLIMDVNPNTAPWVWVSSDALIRAMKTLDTVENRGYLLVKESK